VPRRTLRPLATLRIEVRRPAPAARDFATTHSHLGLIPPQQGRSPMIAKSPISGLLSK